MAQHLSHPEHEGQVERSVPACFTKANKELEREPATYRPWVCATARARQTRVLASSTLSSALRLLQPPPTSSPPKEPDKGGEQTWEEGQETAPGRPLHATGEPQRWCSVSRAALEILFLLVLKRTPLLLPSTQHSSFHYNQLIFHYNQLIFHYNQLKSIKYFLSYVKCGPWQFIFKILSMLIFLDPPLLLYQILKLYSKLI